jgi:hypothetical protein
MHAGDDIPAPLIACMMRLQFDVQQVHAESVCSTRWYYTHVTFVRLFTSFLIVAAFRIVQVQAFDFFFAVELLNLLYDPLCMSSLVGFASFMDFEQKGEQIKGLGCLSASALAL